MEKALAITIIYLFVLYLVSKIRIIAFKYHTGEEIFSEILTILIPIFLTINWIFLN